MVTARPVGNNFCGVWRTAQGAALQPRVINRSELYWPLARTVWPTEASVQGWRQSNGEVAADRVGGPRSDCP
jgi:hypothetical protein